MKTHSEYKIFDAHCDTMTRLMENGGRLAENRYNLDTKRMELYREYTQIFACCTEPKHSAVSMERFKRMTEFMRKQYFGSITPIISIEGADMIKSIDDVDYLYSCGVRCIALTWNHSNQLAGGADSPDHGLTELGKRVIRRMNELGIILDVSHLNDRSFYDASSVNTGKLIATHSNSRYVCGHRRNLTDDMFRLIRDSGGCAGLNLYPPFLTDKSRCTSSDVISHVSHWLELGGENSIGLGTDLDGTDDILPEDIHGAEDIYILLDKLNAEFGREITEKISYKNMRSVFGE